MNWKLLTHQLDLFSHQVNVYGIQFAVCLYSCQEFANGENIYPISFLDRGKGKDSMQPGNKLIMMWNETCMYT